MELTIKDRLVIPELLPRHGRLIEMQLVNSIMQLVLFAPAEIHEFEIKDSQTGTVWNPKKERMIDKQFTPEQITIIKKGIDNLDKDSQITPEMVETIMKFQ